MQKHIRYFDFPRGEAMESPSPDGMYAVISRNYSHHSLIPLVFPWSVTLYEFRNGRADERLSSSSPETVLNDRHVDKVVLVGLVAHERSELNARLAAKQIELVLDSQQ